MKCFAHPDADAVAACARKCEAYAAIMGVLFLLLGIAGCWVTRGATSPS